MEVSVGLMAHVQPSLIYFLGSDKGSAKKFGRATTIVTLPKAVAERSASEQRKRKNESLVTSGCAGGDLVKKHSAEALRGSILR